MADFLKAIPLILMHEGEAYTNDPQDPGGPTKWGITIPDLPQGATAADIQALSEDQAREIYRNKYWDPIRGDEIVAQSIADIYLDIAVCKGLTGATELMRLALKLQPKKIAWGRLDDETLKAVNAPRLAWQLAFDFLAACDAARIERVRANPPLAKFLPGWLRRNKHDLAHAFGLAMLW